MNTETNTDAKLYNFHDYHAKDAAVMDIKPYDDIQERINDINLTSGAIMALAKTLSGFQLDDDTNNAIPQEIKNGFVIGGMLHAIETLAEKISSSAEVLGEQLKQ